MTYQQIEQVVKHNLSEKRFYHSQCVAKQCEELAKIYNVPIEKAKLVGIAHDIAKEMKKEEMIQYAKENSIKIDEIEKYHIKLLHAKIGADICKKQFSFDEQMVRAIEAKTTGKKQMDMLAKILFVADATGDDRSWEDLVDLRNTAKEDMNSAVLYILDLNIKERIEKKKMIHLDSIYCRNELLM